VSLGRYKLVGKEVVPVEADLGSPEWMAWAQAFENLNGLFRTTLPSGTVVSTIFLGFDHGFGSSRPVLFETMAFEAPDNEPVLGRRRSLGAEVDSCRSCTYAEAELVHMEMVEALQQREQGALEALSRAGIGGRAPTVPDRPSRPPSAPPARVRAAARQSRADARRRKRSAARRA
jgi:hypothetical protein